VGLGLAMFLGSGAGEGRTITLEPNRPPSWAGNGGRGGSGRFGPAGFPSPLPNSARCKGE